VGGGGRRATADGQLRVWPAVERLRGRRGPTSDGCDGGDGLRATGRSLVYKAETEPEARIAGGGDFFCGEREQRGFPRCGDGATAKPLWGLACGDTVRGGGGSTSGGGLRCGLRFFSWESAWRNRRNNIRRYSSCPGRAGGPQHIPCVWCV
jgi:hypothetical protein